MLSQHAWVSYSQRRTSAQQHGKHIGRLHSSTRSRARRCPVRAKSLRGLTFAAVDIQLLMRWSPLRACAPVGAPHMFWCAAECD